ncbi:MAG: HEAT repeat domain-containing protein [Bacteroidetes bacterium]|nr:MAG: HEAT repeat domain-containing protein [Bacteroidota bacterium]
MTDPFNFELERNPEQEKDAVFSYLNKKTMVYKPLLSALIDTAYKVQTSRTISDKDIEVLRKGLFESYIVVCGHYSGKFLCQLSFVDKRVQDVLKELATNKNSAVRFNAIMVMLYRPCDEVLKHVINLGLNDKSARVRAKTADVISRLDLKEYASILQEYIDKEEKRKVKDEMEYCLYWLTHDYKIEEKSEYGYSIWVKTETGGTGVTINDEQLKQLDKTIEKIKNGTFRYE